MPNTQHHSSVIATFLSFIPTSVYLNADTTALVSSIQDDRYYPLFVAGAIAVVSNLLIKIGDRIILCVAGYKLGDLIFRKFFLRYIRRKKKNT